jgi:hypothetical protein
VIHELRGVGVEVEGTDLVVERPRSS